MWVFGYGSLIFRPSFAYTQHLVATAPGWARRFWQGSPDHRGTPEAPGRVVTLVPDRAAATTGVAFEIPLGQEDAVLADLEDRERAGYQRHDLALETKVGVLTAVTFLAPEGNPDWLGDAPLAEMAAHIARSSGPSGRNDQYLFALAAALVDIGADDDHVATLAAAVRRLAS